MDVHVNKHSDKRIGTAFCTPSDTKGKSHRAPLSFAEEHAMHLKCRSLRVQEGRRRIGEVQSWAQKTLKLRKDSSYRTVMSLSFFVLSYSRCAATSKCSAQVYSWNPSGKQWKNWALLKGSTELLNLFTALSDLRLALLVLDLAM